MKKLAKFLGVIGVLFISAALIIPLVVDVDKYRPQIVVAAQQKINGTLELGKLSLSLWGQIRIAVDGLKLRDTSGNEVVSVGTAYFHIPLMSLVLGSPVLNFKMNQPTLNVVKNQAGKLNLLSLVKVALPQTASGSLAQKSQGPSPVASRVPVPSAPSAETSKKDSIAFPAIVSNARLGIELSHALLNYSDDLTGLKSDVKNLNLILKDISLSHPTKLEVWADLDTRLGKQFRLKGPVRIKGLATPQWVGEVNPQARLVAKLDLDAVEITAAGLFEKKSGMVANIELNMVGSETEVIIETLQARFLNAVIKVGGRVSQLSQVPTLGLSIQSNEINLKPWAEMIPLLKEYEFGGSAQMDLTLKGTAAQPGYQGKFVVGGLTLKLPRMKTKPVFDGVATVSTDRVDSLLWTMKAPGNEVKIQGRIVSFSHPRMDFSITSPGMDLDQLIEFPQMSKKSNALPATSGVPSAALTGAAAPNHLSRNDVSGESNESKSKADYDALLSPFRENKILAATELNVALEMKSLKAYQVKMSEIGCNLSYKNLLGELKNCGLKVFSGTVQATFQTNFKAKTPLYSFTSQVSGLDMSQAIESQMSLFKDTLTGKANLTFRGRGASFNPDPAMAALNGSGNMKVENAVFATIDVMKMVKNGLEESLRKLAEKIPALNSLNEKMIHNLPSHASRYESVSSDFTISDGKFRAPNFVAQATPNQGIDLKGNTTVGLKDYSLDTNWEVIDTYNLTHLRDLSIQEGGVLVPHLFAEGNAPVHFKVHAGCTVMLPCYSYAEVPTYLSKVALTNIGNAMAGKAKAEIREKAGSFIEQVAPKELSPDLKDKLKGLFH